MSRYYDAKNCRFINADDVDVLFTDSDEITDTNLYTYCNNNPVNKVDNDGDLAQSIFLAHPVLFLVGAVLTVMYWSYVHKVRSRTTYRPVFTLRNKNKASVSYSKKKSRSTKKAEPRVNKPIARRKRFNSRKKAKQAAQRAGRGKIRKDYSKRGAHFHPDVKEDYRKTPKGVSRHDHFYYPTK